MEAILGGDDNEALKNYSVIFEKLLRLRQGNLITDDGRGLFTHIVLTQFLILCSLLFWTAVDSRAP